MSELEGIAIIGMHGRFPGADSVEDLWQNLAAGRDTISFFTDDELAEAGLDVESLKASGHYVPARGVIRDAECFDRGFFGIHPKEAEVMDPQHRIFLEGCWEVLERSGYAPDRIPVPVGIYCGATFNTYYMHALNNRPELIELVGHDQVMFGNEKDYIATRTAYKLNLSGPAISLNTACSSSLTAICQACQALLTFQCDMAIAGGVSVTVPQTRGYHFQEGDIGSPDGHTRSFDARAEGTVFSNGLALVVLKRVDEALADGDQIYGVIKGFAINNDGADRVSFTAPGVDGQAEVIALAQSLAGVEPDDVSYVEAHGTATPVGDPIEVAALTEVFRRGTSRKQFCAIGSVKANVGHLDAASGAAGLIKTALALHHREIPGNPHFTQPNSKLDLEDSPFYVNRTLVPWPRAGRGPRCAGVSSFGTGGTNAHVIVEEAPPGTPSGTSRSQQLLLLSAKTPEALDRMRRNLLEHLQSCPDVHLADTAFTLQTGRSEFLHRQFVVCDGVQQACSLLESPKPPRAVTAKPEHKDPPVVFMFPGQGAQFAGMGADLYQQESVFRDVVDRCAGLLRPLLQEDVRDILFPSPEGEAEAREKIRQTRFTQPALFVIEYALATLWMSWGVRPTAMIGHSVGELVAACLAGVLKLEDAVTLIAHRAELLQSMPTGSMLAVRMPEVDVVPYLTPQLAIAAVNSPALCVVAGPHESVDVLEKQLTQRGVSVKRLRTSHAFHSPMMDPVIAPWTELLRRVEFAEPKIPYVSNVTADWIQPVDAMSPEYWAGHVRNTVRFSDGIAKLLQDPSQVLLEVGPGSGLTQLAWQHPLRDKSQRVVTSMPYTDDQPPPGLLAALGSLWLAGVQVDWRGFYAAEQRRRVVLPTYSFERTRCWPSTPASPMTTPHPAVEIVDHGETLSVPVPVNLNHDSSQQPVTSAVPDIPRQDRLTAEVRTLLEELSGCDMCSADGSASLVECGLDSLLLTQVATLLRKKYRAKITFRQLMEELSTIDAIVSYLDASMPAEPVSEKAAGAVRGSHGSDSSRASSATAGASSDPPSGNGPSFRALLEQHLALTSQLLNKMQQGPEPTIRSQPAVDHPPAIVIDSRRESALSAAGPRASHGPYKPLDSNRASSLTDWQKERLDVLIQRYTRRTATSKKLAAQNRPILADPRSVAGFKSVWKEAVYPIHTIRSEGSKIWDIDGNEYVDFVMGFGASLFGHRPPFVVQAVKAQLDAGFETGPIHPLAGEVAGLVHELTGAERVAFCGTGSEAVLAAIRVSRTVTARDKIVIFEGAYHGIFDEVLARAVIRHGELRSTPTAPGIPDGSFGEIIVLPYGNPESLEIIEQYGHDIAAVLVEPIQARRLDLVPREFLLQLRQITAATGTALVFDEVVTGFRVEPGGAQTYFGIKADLATYGKVVGGGLPIGLVTGKAVFMDALDGGPWQFGDESAPEVGVTFFAGTFVRHPLALAAAKSVLTHIQQEGPELQVRVAQKAARVATAFRELFDRYQAPYHLSHFSSLVFVSVPTEFTYGALLFFHLRDRGIHIFENRLFVLTTAHTDDDIEQLVKAMEDSLQEMRQSGFLARESGPTGVVTGSPSKCSPVVARPFAAKNDESQLPPRVSTVDAENESRCSTLEEIQAEGQRPPLFCMPAADGLTLVYHELADRLGRNQPVYGLNSPGAIGEEVPDSFEEMATRFVEDIREIWPHGPYLLMGYCSGGSVAFEVAQQLVAAGEPVALVCGIETYDWSTSLAARPRWWVKMDYEMQRLYYHARNFLTLDFQEQCAFMRSKVDRLKSRLRVWRNAVAGLFRRKKRQRGGSVDWSDLWRRHDEISVRYIPKTFPGRLLLIRPRTDYRCYVGKEDLQASGGVRIERLSGFPACLMTPPYVDQVADLIKASIEDGLRECGMDVRAMNEVPNPSRITHHAESLVEQGQISRC